MIGYDLFYMMSNLILFDLLYFVNIFVGVNLFVDINLFIDN